MDTDLLYWAQDSPIGVGEAGGSDLTSLSRVAPPAIIDPRTKPSRSRPNRGRDRNKTNRNPPLAEPPWEMLRELGIPLPASIVNLPTPPSNWRRGVRYIEWRKAVLSRYGGICHLCGHKDANTADHLIPVSIWNNQPYEPMLARPAHGIEGCPTCHVKCNSSRGNRALATQIGQYQPPVAM